MTPPGIFSVATCLSLVDTVDDKLVNIEYDRVKDLEVKKVNTRTKPSISMKRDFLRSLLIKSNLDELHGHISLEDKILQKILQTPKSVMIETSTNTEDAGEATSDSTIPCDELSLPSTQPFSSCDVEINTAVEVIIPCVSFKQLGRREVCYYGNSPFRYGKTVFPSNAYPDPLPVYLMELTKKLKCVDTNFSLDNYSCMLTLYRDGTIASPQSCDITTVDNSSETINVTMGATRTYEFINQIGPVNIFLHEAVGGSVFSMTEASQCQWSHGITASVNKRAPTLTLSFRRTKVQEPKPKPPPLGLPGQNYNPKRDILMGKHSEFGSTENRRTLLLTDSILNGIYPQNLSSHKHEVVIKKTMYYLTDFPNYQDKF